MPTKKPVSCSRPTGGAVGESPPKETKTPETTPGTGGPQMIQVGKKAPDFTASAYFDGDFVSVQLSEYLGKWVVLCFYPGDFTFV